MQNRENKERPDKDYIFPLEMHFIFNLKNSASLFTTKYNVHIFTVHEVGFTHTWQVSYPELLDIKARNTVITRSGFHTHLKS